MFVFTHKLHWTEPKPERAVKGRGVIFSNISSPLNFSRAMIVYPCINDRTYCFCILKKERNHISLEICTVMQF